MLSKYKISINRNLLVPILLSVGLIVALTGYVIIQRNRVYQITIAAGSKEGESYLFSQVMAKVVAIHQPKIKITVIETQGSEENIKLLEENKVQLATAQADIPVLPSARIVSNLFPDMFQLVVKENSGIKDISNLKGKRIGLPPQGSGQYQSFLFLAQHYNLKINELFAFAVSEKETDAAFNNNQVDAVFRVRPPGNKSILDLVQKRGGRLVAIDQAGAMKIKKPSLEAGFIPKGAYQGFPAIPPTDLPTVAVQRVLLANQKVEADVIRQITSILYERRQELATLMPEAAYINPPNLSGVSLLPIHPGAQIYYNKDKPSFLQENADWLGLFLSIGVLICSWGWQLKSEFEKKRKNQGDGYNQDILLLIKEIQGCQDLQSTEKIRQRLFNEFGKVVNALDCDDISPEAFQSFTFTWEAAIAALRDRQNILMSIPRKPATPNQRRLQP